MFCVIKNYLHHHLCPQAIRDWADGQKTTEVPYDRAVALLVSKGHSKEVSYTREVSCHNLR